MEDEDEKVDPDFLKGFNEGYLLAHHNPELAEKLAAINSELSRVVGLKAGREQYQAELLQTQQQEHVVDKQIVPDKTDIIDQLRRRQLQAKDEKSLTPKTPQQKPDDTDDIISQLRKKQEQGYRGHDLDP